MLDILKVFSKKDESFDFILDFLKKDELLKSRKDDFLNSMSKAFGNYALQSEIAFDELEKLIEVNPQLIIDATRNFFTHRDTLTKMLESSRKQQNIKNSTVMDKITYIADMYECTSMLQLPAYLFSKRRAKYENLVEPLVILSHFKNSYITSKNKDHLRVLRNSTSHKFTIENDEIIAEKGERISIADIEELHQKFDQITSWWMTFAIYTLWDMPKFGLLVVLGMFSTFKNKSSSWGKFNKAINLFYGDIIDEMQKEKKEEEKSKHTKFERLRKDFRHLIQHKLLKEFYDRKTNVFLENNVSAMMKRLAYHLHYFTSELNQISSGLSNEEDQERIDSFSAWISGIYSKIEEINEIFKEYPEIISLVLKKKKMGEKKWKKMIQECKLKKLPKNLTDSES